MKSILSALFVLGLAVPLHADYQHQSNGQSSNGPETYQNSSYSESNTSPEYARPFNDHFATPEDKALLDDLRNELKDGWFTKGYEQIAISVNQGHVTLAGTVKTQADREKVEKMVRDTKGVKSVNSQIGVQEQKNDKDKPKNEFKYDKAASPTDMQLNKKIRDNVSLGYLWTSYEGVILNTNNGTVILEGTVDDIDNEHDLINGIRKVEGVKGVESHLKIKNR